MKLLVLLAFLSTACFAQGIPKGADRIEVQTTLSDSLAYEKLIDILSADGWVRDKEDIRRKEVITQYKPTKYAWRLRLLTSTRQGKVTFRGQCAAEAMGTKLENEPIAYKGMGGAMNKLNFEYMNRLAMRYKESVTGSIISYPAP